jgi:hypothetical protein
MGRRQEWDNGSRTLIHPFSLPHLLISATSTVLSSLPEASRRPARENSSASPGRACARGGGTSQVTALRLPHLDRPAIAR